MGTNLTEGAGVALSENRVTVADIDLHEIRAKGKRETDEAQGGSAPISTGSDEAKSSTESEVGLASY